MRNNARNHRRGLRGWLFLMTVLAMPWFAGGASAHPHVFITVETEVITNADKAIIGFRHKWSFDEMYASLATDGLDKNSDGVYSAAELKSLLELNISSLKEFEYFTFPRVEKKLLGRGDPKDYSLEYKNNVLSLYLTIPLAEPVPFNKISDFSLVISDPSFYVDFAFVDKKAVRLSSDLAECTPVIKDPRPDPKEVARLQALGNDYFADPDVAARIASLYAKIVTINCAKSPH